MAGVQNLIRIGVAGDSFFSPLKSERIHFADHLAKHYNAELVATGKPGGSNLFIRQQLDFLINEQVDFIVWGSTNSDRIEYVHPDSISGYDTNKGLFNYTYDQHNIPFKDDNRFVNNVVSDTLINIVDTENGNPGSYSPKQLQVITDWFHNLYDEGLAYIKDLYLFESAVQSLIDSKIPWLGFIGSGAMQSNYFQQRKHLKNIVWDMGPEHTVAWEPHQLSNDEDARGIINPYHFHTTAEGQHIIADGIIKHVQEHQIF